MDTHIREILNLHDEFQMDLSLCPCTRIPTDLVQSLKLFDQIVKHARVVHVLLQIDIC